MATDTHHLSFTDHLALYLPHFLRPPLPRDLRPLPLTAAETIDEPPTPTSTPQQPDTTPDRERHFQDTHTIVEESSPPVTPTTHTHTHTQREREHENENEKEGVREEDVGFSARRVREVFKKKNEQERSKEGYHVSLILTNSGSVARDHLASERTFLAYVRTSLALASTGVALVQLFTIANNTGSFHPAQEMLVRRFATPLGSTIIILGLAVLLLGCLRYFAIQTALTRGVFPAARMTVMFIVVALAVVTGIVFGVLVKARQGS